MPRDTKLKVRLFHGLTALANEPVSVGSALVCEQGWAGSFGGLRGQEILQGRAGGVDALTNRYKSTPCKRLLKSAKVMLDGLRQEKFSDRASQDAFQGS